MKLHRAGLLAFLIALAYWVRDGFDFYNLVFLMIGATIFLIPWEDFDGPDS